MALRREMLPARRGHEVFDFVFSRGKHDSGTRYTVGLGRYDDDRLAEVFLECHKLSSAMTDDARDVAMTLSVALQHGVPLSAFAAGLARYNDGRPCGLTGCVVDEILKRLPGSDPESAVPTPPLPFLGGGASAAAEAPCHG